MGVGIFFSTGLSSSDSSLFAGVGPDVLSMSGSPLTCMLPPEEGELCLAGDVDTGDDLKYRSLVSGRFSQCFCESDIYL